VAAAVLGPAGGLGNQAEAALCIKAGQPAQRQRAVAWAWPTGNLPTPDAKGRRVRSRQHLLEAEAMLGGSLDFDGSSQSGN